MLNPRALAVAVLATGAGAVLFLSTGQESASPATPAGLGPVPVVIPPAVFEIPSANPVVPAAERPAPPSSAAVAPSTRPVPKPTTASPVPARKPAPMTKRFVAPRVAPSTTEQPRPVGVEPNGSGGWQLPACYDTACQMHVHAADPCTGTGTECLNATLGQLGIVNLIPGLIGGR